MKKIGLFFGSFDPIHIGHLSLLKECSQYFDHIELIPAYQNPFKKKSTPYSIRLLMCEEAIKETGLDDSVEVNDIEETLHHRGMQPFTCDVLKKIIQPSLDLEDNFSWILTEETLLDIYTWNDYDYLKSIPKTGFNLSDDTYKRYKDELNIDFNIKTFKCDIHSIDIRNSIDGRPYITQNVYNLILLKGLYND